MKLENLANRVKGLSNPDIEEDGSVAVFTVLAVLVLAILLVLMIEISMIMSVKTAYDNDLNVAREATLESGFQMKLKNSDDPGYDIAVKLASSLKSNGYEGKATVAFKELSRDEIFAGTTAAVSMEDTERVRCLAYQIILSDPYRSLTVPGANLLGNAVVKAGTECGICPYGMYYVYRPAELRESPGAGTEQVYEIDCSNNVEDDAVTEGTDQGADQLLSTGGMQAACDRALDLAEKALEADPLD